MDLSFGGGINQRDDLNVSMEECIEGRNFRLDAQAKTFRPRLPFDLKGTVTNEQPVSGIAQLIKRDDTDTTLIFAGGQVYSASDAWAFSDVGDINTSTGIRGTYWSLNDHLVITDKDKVNTLHQWDGSTFKKNKHGIGNGTVTTATGFTGVGTTMDVSLNGHGLSADDLVTITGTSPSAWNGEHLVTSASANGFTYTIDNSTTTATGTLALEKSVDLYAKYAVVWNNRVWLFNIKTDTDDNPHMILASQFENKEVFDSSQRAAPYTTGGYSGDEAFFL